jgi:hypothetical protein
MTKPDLNWSVHAKTSKYCLRQICYYAMLLIHSKVCPASTGSPTVCPRSITVLIVQQIFCLLIYCFWTPLATSAIPVGPVFIGYVMLLISIPKITVASLGSPPTVCSWSIATLIVQQFFLPPHLLFLDTLVDQRDTSRSCIHWLCNATDLHSKDHHR